MTQIAAAEKTHHQKDGKASTRSTRAFSLRKLLYSVMMLILAYLYIFRRRYNPGLSETMKQTTSKASCAEIVAYDRDEMEGNATSSINYPPTPCDTLRLKRHGPGKTWRKATWAKVDVLHTFASNISKYDYVLVRDIDTKVNTSYVLSTLRRHASNKTFAIGFRREGQEAGTEKARCDEVVAVTNWFAFDNRSDKLHREWKNVKITDRINSDQVVLNERFQPCCRDDVLCLDKCEEEVGEVHCRRRQAVNAARHYGDQQDCVLNRIERNVEYYDPTGTYSCNGTIPLTFHNDRT